MNPDTGVEQVIAVSDIGLYSKTSTLCTFGKQGIFAIIKGSLNSKDIWYESVVYDKC